jgi:hypothetical protein
MKLIPEYLEIINMKLHTKRDKIILIIKLKKFQNDYNRNIIMDKFIKLFQKVF